MLGWLRGSAARTPVLGAVLRIGGVKIGIGPVSATGQDERFSYALRSSNTG